MSRNGRVALRVTIPRGLLNDEQKAELFAWWRDFLIPAWLNRPEGVKLELVFPEDVRPPDEDP